MVHEMHLHQERRQSGIQITHTEGNRCCLKALYTQGLKVKRQLLTAGLASGFYIALRGTLFSQFRFLSRLGPLFQESNIIAQWCHVIIISNASMRGYKPNATSPIQNHTTSIPIGTIGKCV